MPDYRIRWRLVGPALLCLVAAAMVGCEESVEPGPEAGADRQAELDFDLFAAARGGRAEEVRELIEQGARVNHRTSTGFAPLHVAIKYGREDAAKALLEGGADPNLAAPHGGAPPLSMAIPEPAILRILLEHGADPAATDEQGKTPLHDVAQAGAEGIEAARILLEHEADINAKDAEGWTPLDRARAPHRVEPSPELINFLTEHGAEAGAGADAEPEQGPAGPSGGAPGGAGSGESPG